jgi:hypothetical protein
VPFSGRFPAVSAALQVDAERNANQSASLHTGALERRPDMPLKDHLRLRWLPAVLRNPGEQEIVRPTISGLSFPNLQYKWRRSLRFASIWRLPAAQCRSSADIPPFGHSGHSHVQRQKRLSSSSY